MEEPEYVPAIAAGDVGSTFGSKVRGLRLMGQVAGTGTTSLATKALRSKNMCLELLLRSQNGGAAPTHRVSPFVVTPRVVNDNEEYIRLMPRTFQFALHALERCGVRVYAERFLHPAPTHRRYEEGMRLTPPPNIDEAGIVAIVPSQVPGCPAGSSETYTLRLPITGAERDKLLSGGVPRTDGQPEGEKMLCLSSS